MNNNSNNKPPKQILTDSVPATAQKHGSESLSSITKNNSTPNPRPK